MSVPSLPGYHIGAGMHVSAQDAALAYMLKNSKLQVYMCLSMNVVIHFVIVVFVIINYNLYSLKTTPQSE